MAENKVTRLRQDNAKSPARELSPRAQVRQAVYQQALNLLALPKLDMRVAITTLDLETTRKAMFLENRNLRRREVLLLLHQQELLLLGDNNERLVVIRKNDMDSITNTLLLAREHARCPLDDGHRQEMRKQIDRAIASLGGLIHG